MFFDKHSVQLGTKSHRWERDLMIKKLLLFSEICHKCKNYEILTSFTSHSLSSYCKTTSFSEKAWKETVMKCTQPQTAVEIIVSQTIFCWKLFVKLLTPWMLDILKKIIACSSRCFNFSGRMKNLDVSSVGIFSLSVSFSERIIKQWTNRKKSIKTSTTESTERPPARTKKLPK